MSTTVTGSTAHGIVYTRSGDGPPLVLLHGLGSSRLAWSPVAGKLSRSHTVYALDLPGFGDSAPLPESDPSTPARLAEAVDEALAELGIEAPHVVGNSLGGWVTLELAHVRRLSSLTLLDPAGLWRKGQPTYCTVSLALTWLACRFFAPALVALSRWATGRRLLFWQVFAHPEELTQDDVRSQVAAMGRSAGFLPTFRAIRNLRYRADPDVVAGPVTVAFGSKDRILLARQSRFVDQLPPQTRHVTIADAGHVPMSDAPERVAEIVLTSAAMSQRSGPAPSSVRDRRGEELR
jgi:pimeloyl-ACP methyl ester carboxylesterase